jgi:transposase
MARKPLIPNPENASLEELETAAKCAPSQQAHNRYRAIIALVLGVERVVVAKMFGVSDRAVRRWVLAYNEQGIDGLIDEPKSGRPRKIPSDKVEQCRTLLEHPEKADQVHWTGVKFHGYLREKLEMDVGYSTVIRFLHELKYRLKVPQPWPDRQDEAARRAFLERLRGLIDDPEVEIWFGDECGIEGDPRPRRRWVQRGQKARVTKNGDHIRMNVTGIVCPRTGEVYALEFSHTDTEVFQCFLDEANKDLTFERKRQVLIVDNASWHKRQTLRWGRFEPLYLPPYSPDLNPIERLWLILKAEWFSDFIAKTRDALCDRLDQALRWIIQRKDGNQRTCAIRTKL